ncbi:MAG: c-type cytochrome biosis protein CcmI, partial [Pseudomonadota bacterium]
RIGAPGYPDLPLAERLAMSQAAMENRPSQAEAEAAAPDRRLTEGVDPSFLTLMDQLRQAVADRPGDLRGLELLASNEARLGNYPAARAAMEQLVAAKADAATAEDFAALAEIRVLAAGGIVTPEAEEALIRALTLDPKNGTARFYSGLMFAQVGRHDQTFQLWEPLLREGPPDAPWIAPIRDGIEDVAWRAGLEYTLPETLAGPDAGAVAAAADMAPEDRQAMIEGMVAQLGERLANEGGTPEEWAQLVSSLAVLGRTEEAQTIYNEALAKFEGQRASQSFLREQALNAGLTP